MVQFARTKRSEGNFLPLYHGDPVNSYLHQTLQFWCFLPFLLVPKGVFSNGARWGFACCHQTMKNSYCVPIQKRELEVGEGWAQKSKSLPPFSQEFWLLRTSRIFGRFLVVWGCLRVYIYIYKPVYLPRLLWAGGGAAIQPMSLEMVLPFFASSNHWVWLNAAFNMTFKRARERSFRNVLS